MKQDLERENRNLSIFATKIFIKKKKYGENTFTVLDQNILL